MAEQWWLAHLDENTFFQGVNDPLQSATLDFVIEPLLSLDNFWNPLIKEYCNHFAKEEALEKLMSVCHGRTKSKADFDSSFMVISAEAETSEVTKMSHYWAAISANIQKVAAHRVGWESALTLPELQSVAVAAAREILDARGSIFPPSLQQPVSIPQAGVSVPDPLAMDLDFSALLVGSSKASSFPTKVFASLCIPHGICTNCLEKWSLSHMVKGPDGCNRCPNTQASRKDHLQMLRRLQTAQKANDPSSVPPLALGPPKPIQNVFPHKVAAQQYAPFPSYYGSPYPPLPAFFGSSPAHHPENPPPSFSTLPFTPAQFLGFSLYLPPGPMSFPHQEPLPLAPFPGPPSGPSDHPPPANILAAFANYLASEEPLLYDPHPDLPLKLAAVKFVGTSTNNSRLVLQVFL